MKDRLLEKMLKKNYNDRLEKILSSKAFNEDVKNSLLNIFYNIETGYKDYSQVKKDEISQDEYIENLLKAIQQKCNNIKFVKPNTPESEILGEKTFFIDKAHKKIICFPIDRKILYAINKMQKEDIIVKAKYDFLEKTFSNLLNVGSCINSNEPLRDFNGFSWNIITKDIENINYNLIYQDLIILIGDNFLNDWTNNYNNDIDYFGNFKELLKKKYGKSLQEKIINLLLKLSVILEMEVNIEFKKEMQEKYNVEKEEYAQFEDKENFIVNFVKKKKEIEKQIKYIDKTLHDKVALINEYQERNEKLPLNQKIFSIRVLKNILKEERKEYINKIDYYNSMMNPKNFINKRRELEKKIKYLKISQEDLEVAKDKEIIRLQKLVLKCLKAEIQECTDKKKLINYVYKIRYFNLLPIKYGTSMWQEQRISKEREIVEQELIKKCIEQKVIDEISTKKQIFITLFKNIFTSNIISLEGIYIKVINQKEELYLQIFDEDIQEKKIKLRKIMKEDLKIKLNKKIKLFI